MPTSASASSPTFPDDIRSRIYAIHAASVGVCMPRGGPVLPRIALASGRRQGGGSRDRHIERLGKLEGPIDRLLERGLS